MTSSVILSSAALQSVLCAAHQLRTSTGSAEIQLVLGALFVLVPCDWVRWTRIGGPTSGAIDSRTYPANRQSGVPTVAAHELRIDCAFPCGIAQALTLGRETGPPFGPSDLLVFELLEPHLDAALRLIGFPAPRLTAREVEVLRCVREGMGNAQIARQLHVAESTVVKHLEHVFSRSGAHSRTEAVRLCEPSMR